MDCSLGLFSKYLPIQPAFVCLIEILLLLGNKNGGTPALLLPDDKGRSGGGEQPGRRSPGGWRSEGGRDFYSRRPGRIEYFQAFSQHLIWLPGRFVQ